MMKELMIGTMVGGSLVTGQWWLLLAVVAYIVWTGYEFK